MINLDSSIVTVLGDHKKKRDAIVDRLDLQTVGDLLRHFPRRYVKTGELTKIDELHDGLHAFDGFHLRQDLVDGENVAEIHSLG